VPFAKGKGGRPLGARNKTTLAAKEAIEAAAARLGGITRLVAWAKENPLNERVFWGTIYPKLLPLQVAGPSGQASTVRRLIIELDDAQPNS
jgi:hypothetical protein